MSETVRLILSGEKSSPMLAEALSRHMRLDQSDSPKSLNERNSQAISNHRSSAFCVSGPISSIPEQTNAHRMRNAYGAAMSYEDGMIIVWDQVLRGVAIIFRGVPHYLDGPFPDQKTGIQAAERHCRQLGWSDGKLK